MSGFRLVAATVRVEVAEKIVREGAIFSKKRVAVPILTELSALLSKALEKISI